MLLLSRRSLYEPSVQNSKRCGKISYCHLKVKVQILTTRMMVKDLQILLAKIHLPKRRKVHHNSELLSTKVARVPGGNGYAANEISGILARDELSMPDVSTTISPWAVLSWMVHGQGWLEHT